MRTWQPHRAPKGQGRSARSVLADSLDRVIAAYATGRYPGIVADLEQARDALLARESADAREDDAVPERRAG